LSDTQIAQLKKEYDPLKGKTITSAQYQQLKNLLFKLQDGDLEKLQKQNIPFASSGAATALRVRKATFKVTKVTVPGLEGMAEGAKRYKEMDNVGTSKYTVSFHDGINKHNDGSDFFDMKIFNNKVEKNKFITDLEKKGYRPAKPFSGEEVEVKEEIKESHYSMGQHVIYKPKSMTPRKAQIIQVTEPQVGAYYKIQISPTLMTYAKPDELELDENGANKFMVKQKIMKPISDYLKQKEQEKKPEPKKEGILGAVAGGVLGSAAGIPGAVAGAYLGHKIQQAAKKKKNEEVEKKSVQETMVDEACWTGYKQVGLKKKNGRMVPNCVPEEVKKEQKRIYIESIVAVKNKAEKSGMPYSILKQVYNRGMAAWKGGHRPGATQVQWALARVNSFITKSSGTWGGADSDLAKKVRGS